MASISFQIQSKNENANIYIRLSVGRNKDFKRKTGLIINPENWNKKKNIPKKSTPELKNQKIELDNLKLDIEKSYNEAISQGAKIDGAWLEKQINKKSDEEKNSKAEMLTNYFESYIKLRPNRATNGKMGVAPSTLKKYISTKNKIKQFEIYVQKEFFIRDVDLDFTNKFIKYLKEIDKLANNTIGRYIKCVKTICLDAEKNNFTVNPQLKMIKGFSEKVENIYLTFDELEKIEKTNYERKALDNARNWLLIGTMTGQRISDLLVLTKENIVLDGKRKMIELVQQKTNKPVTIPLHPKVNSILKKYNGNFPNPISAAKFNEHLKEVAKIAEINKPTQGGKMNDKTKRKEYGTYKKWELVTSHICRRSFATNHYGKLSTTILRNITGHSTETQFLEYIGKKTIDYARQLAEFWEKENK